jgi:hypothetical protein
MSDDIDRLKTVLENLAQVNDELKDISEAFRDVVNACSPVDRNEDSEGHGALWDITTDIALASSLLQARQLAIQGDIRHLGRKVALI